VDEALGGGEDYELLATLPGAAAFEAAAAELRAAYGTPLTVIGDVMPGDGPVEVGEDGSERPLDPAGWDHFAS
jgi:thiamine-monophosphate kinase